MSVRVLRVMEYVYPNQDKADADMSVWFIPPMGSKKLGPEKSFTVIRSTVFLPEASVDE